MWDIVPGKQGLYKIGKKLYTLIIYFIFDSSKRSLVDLTAKSICCVDHRLVGILIQPLFELESVITSTI